MTKNKKKLILEKWILPGLLILLLFCLLILTYQATLSNKFFPRIFIGDTNVSFLTKEEAYKLLKQKESQRKQTKLEFSYKEQKYSIDFTKLNPDLDYLLSLDQAFDIGHTGTPWQQFESQIRTFLQASFITPDISLKDLEIEKMAKSIDQSPQDAIVWLDDQTQTHIKEGIPGASLNQKKLKDQIKSYLAFGTPVTSLPIENIEPNFTTKEAEVSKVALEEIQKEPLKLNYAKNSWVIDVPTLFYLLNVSSGESLLDEKQIESYLKNLRQEIDKPVEEPLFNFDTSLKKVSAFKPAQEGTELDTEQTKKLILASLTTGSKNIDLPVKVVSPKIQTSEINNLGIKELIGQGVSNFAGSIPNRIYNVGLTASKINGTLIPPNEIFSFNRTVGDISAATGFKKAYVIKEGRTVLDDGGGVCQDSTTLFRAALNAGLPIVKRTAHAYRVTYYEQGFPPGLDATVYYPSVDFQFKNDTGHYILIQAYTAGTTLYIDLYGTSDGRVTTISKSVIASQTPPPPELRQDDPTLPRGQVKQVDWAAWGANVSFKRTVQRGQETLISETWRSNYRPWQAVYLVGTKDN